MLAVSAPVPSQTTKRASREMSGSRMLGVSRWNTFIAMRVPLSLQMCIELRIGRTGASEQHHSCRAGGELIGGAGFDMHHRAFDQFVASARVRVPDRPGAGPDIVHRLARMPERDGVAARDEIDMVHRALGGAGAGPDDGDRFAGRVD